MASRLKAWRDNRLCGGTHNRSWVPQSQTGDVLCLAWHGLIQSEDGALRISEHSNRTDVAHQVRGHDGRPAELRSLRGGGFAVRDVEIAQPVGGRPRRRMHLWRNSPDHIFL